MATEFFGYDTLPLLFWGHVKFRICGTPIDFTKELDREIRAENIGNGPKLWARSRS